MHDTLVLSNNTNNIQLNGKKKEYPSTIDKCEHKLMYWSCVVNKNVGKFKRQMVRNVTESRRIGTGKLRL